ncbi:KRAB-A domain-containing protein 2, partial [Trichinella papuae]
LKLVTGRPRHPQSQGAVEPLNGVVQDKLAIWMRENECKRWSMGLKFVQWQINVSVHETTGHSPFKVTFGEEPRIGLESYVLPKSLVEAAETEEEIEEFLTSQEATDEGWRLVHLLDIAFLGVSFDVPFLDKLKVLAPHSRFFRQIIYFSDITPGSLHQIKEKATTSQFDKVLMDRKAACSDQGKRTQCNEFSDFTEACHSFLTFCEECHKKRARKLPKSLVVKPLVSTNLMSQAQVDLINFQTMPDGDFKFIMTYLNHFAKFCILSPLKSKQAEEVASKLLEIFFTFSCSGILQSDNGRSQGAVERLNGVVQDKLSIWIVHKTTGQSPFKVTFGMEPRIGLESYVLPKSLVDAVKTEEETEEFLTSPREVMQKCLNHV